MQKAYHNSTTNGNRRQNKMFRFISLLAFLSFGKCFASGKNLHTFAKDHELKPTFEWYTPPIEREAGAAEKFRYFVNLTPKYEDCEAKDLNVLTGLVKATMVATFKDMDVEFFDVEEAGKQPVPGVMQFLPDMDRNLVVAAAKYGYAGAACRRCAPDDGTDAATARARRKRAAAGRRKLGNDPALEYSNISALMTDALRTEIKGTLALDPKSCFFDIGDSDIQVRLQLMAPAE